jgi:hypothetical protein
MDFYTIVFILVTILILIGLALFGLLIVKIDKWIDRKERVGSESVYKKKPEVRSTGLEVKSKELEVSMGLEVRSTEFEEKNKE